MTLKIRIATRKSELALRQVDIVRSYFGEVVETETIKVTTAGDKILNKSLSDIGGKGLFIKELEYFILNGFADIAVHSMKDMETDIAKNTEISAVLPRGDRSDVLLGNYDSFDNLPDKAIVGTSSVRRAAFAKYYRPDLNIKILRGNVGTRIEKLNSGLYDAIILAKAGLDRLNINDGNIIPNEIILNFFLIDLYFKNLKNLSSAFNIIVPSSRMLLIISDLALAILFRFLKFLICAYEILVITPTLGIIFFVKKSISPFLSIPTSKIPILSSLFILNKEIGTPYLLLNDFFE